MSRSASRAHASLTRMVKLALFDGDDANWHQNGCLPPGELHGPDVYPRENCIAVCESSSLLTVKTLQARMPAFTTAHRPRVRTTERLLAGLGVAAGAPRGVVRGARARARGGRPVSGARRAWVGWWVPTEALSRPCSG